MGSQEALGADLPSSTISSWDFRLKKTTWTNVDNPSDVLTPTGSWTPNKDKDKIECFTGTYKSGDITLYAPTGHGFKLKAASGYGLQIAGKADFTSGAYKGVLSFYVNKGGRLNITASSTGSSKRTINISVGGTIKTLEVNGTSENTVYLDIDDISSSTEILIGNNDNSNINFQEITWTPDGTYKDELDVSSFSPTGQITASRVLDTDKKFLAYINNKQLYVATGSATITDYSKSITQYVNLVNSGSDCSVRFKTTEAGKITLYAKGCTTDQKVVLYNGTSGSEVGRKDITNGTLTKVTFDVAADKVYYLYSSGSRWELYYIASTAALEPWSSDATLSALKVGDKSISISDVMECNTAKVGEVLAATTTTSGATVQILDGSTVLSDGSTWTISGAMSNKNISIKVTALDGVTTKTYTLRLTATSYPSVLYLVGSSPLGWNAYAGVNTATESDGVYTWTGVKIGTIGSTDFTGFAFSTQTGTDGSEGFGAYRYGPSSTTKITLSAGVGESTNVAYGVGGACYQIDPGTYDITLDLKEGSKKVTVRTAAVKASSITLNTTSWENYPLYELDLVATVLPDNAGDKNVTWSSSSDVATVTADGLVKIGKNKNGMAIITATAADGSGVTASCLITAKQDALSANTAVTQIPVGGRAKLTVAPTGTTPEILGCTWTMIDDAGYFWYYSRSGENPRPESDKDIPAYQVKNMWARAFAINIAGESDVTIKGTTGSATSGLKYYISTSPNYSTGGSIVTETVDYSSEVTVTLQPGLYYIALDEASASAQKTVDITEINIVPVAQPNIILSSENITVAHKGYTVVNFTLENVTDVETLSEWDVTCEQIKGDGAGGKASVYLIDKSAKTITFYGNSEYHDSNPPKFTVTLTANGGKTVTKTITVVEVTKQITGSTPTITGYNIIYIRDDKEKITDTRLEVKIHATGVLDIDNLSVKYQIKGTETFSSEFGDAENDDGDGNYKIFIPVLEDAMRDGDKHNSKLFRLQAFNGSASSLYTPYMQIINTNLLEKHDKDDASESPSVIRQGQALLINPDFEYNGAGGWDAETEGYAAPNNWSGNVDDDGELSVDNKVAEAWNRKFKIHQTLTGLTNGVYEVKANALFRTKGKDEAYSEYANGMREVSAEIYGNDFHKPLKNIFDDYLTSADEGTDHGTWYKKFGKFYPDRMGSAAVALGGGKYEVKLYVQVTDGTLELGLRNETANNDCWACFDNVEVKYLGGITDVGDAEYMLVTVPGYKKWPGTESDENPYFGFIANAATRFIYKSADVSQALNKRNDLLLCLRNNNINTIVNRDNIEFRANDYRTGVKIKIPSAGRIKVTYGVDDNKKYIQINNGAAQQLTKIESESTADRAVYYYDYTSGNEALVYLYCADGGTKTHYIYQIEYIPSDAVLLTLPGTYHWYAENGDFGATRTVECGYGVESNGVLIDNNRLMLYAVRGASNGIAGRGTQRRVNVLANGEIELTNTSGNGVKFRVPGAGVIAVTAKRASKPSGNIVITSFDGTTTYQTATWDPQTDGDEYVTTMIQYSGDNPAEVFIKMANSDGVSTYIKEISYYQIDALDIHTTSGKTRAWTGNKVQTEAGGESTGDAKEYSGWENFDGNTIRAIADDNHKVIVSDAGKITFEHPVKEPGEESGEVGTNLAGYVAFPATVKGTVKVYTTAGSVGHQLSIYAGNAIEPNYTQLLDVDPEDANHYQLARTIKLFTDDANRMVYISGDNNVTITKIEWIPGVINGATSDLRPVVAETVWAKDNKFGGCGYPSNVNTYVMPGENVLNAGSKAKSGMPATPANTLLIYSGDGTSHPAYFTTTGNLMLNNTTNDTQRLIEFKVKGRGVVKVVAAGNGPTGRDVDIAAYTHTEGEVISKVLLDEHSITGETHDAVVGGEATVNDEEHMMTLVRHQHSSYHAVYAYYDGSGDEEQSIFVYAHSGGISIQEIHWYPDVNIYDIYESHISEPGCLKITDSYGRETIPQTIFLNPKYISETKPDWEPAEIQRQDSYSFYAKVTTENYVHKTPKEPVWTTSQGGRKGFYDRWILTNAKVSKDSDTHTELNDDDYVPDDVKVDGMYVAITGKGGIDKNEDRPFTLNKATTHVYKKIDDNKVPSGGEDRPAFGIMYVVAGTWEGNRNDMRRIEVLGPPTRLDVDNESEVIYMKKDGEIKIGATPVTEFNDLEVGGVYGSVIDMTYVENPSAVEWKFISGEGGSEGIAEVKSSNVITNGKTETATIKATNTGTTYLRISIPGVFKYDYSGKSAWVETTLEKIIKIVVEENAITLTRVQQKDEIFPKLKDTDGMSAPMEVGNSYTNFVENVDVKYAQVYRITGDYTRDMTFKATISNDIPGNADVTVESDAIKTDGAHDYVVFDFVEVLQNGVGEYGNKYEHINYDATHKLNITDVKKGTSTSDKKVYVAYDQVKEVETIIKKEVENDEGKTEIIEEKVVSLERTPMPYRIIIWPKSDEKYMKDEAGNSFESILTFKTYHDDCGTEIETFIYNASQRGHLYLDDEKKKIALKNDVEKERLLDEHQLAVPYTATKIKPDGTPADDGTGETMSWYSNHRSYIRLSNFKDDCDDEKAAEDYDRHLIAGKEAGKDAEITLKPYNTTFDSNEQREAIDKVEVYFDLGYIKTLDSSDETVLLTYVVGDDETEVSLEDVRANNGKTTWTYSGNRSTDWVHDMTIKVKEGLMIDQIKIDYYSATRTVKEAYKTFTNYKSSTFGDNLEKGVEFSGLGDDPAIKMTFRQTDNGRYFALHEKFSRDTSDDITRGEKGARNEKYNSLLIRDDKTAPCELRIFNKKNIANIVGVEFIYEKDLNNFATARDIFCTSDPRFNPSADPEDNMVGWKLTDAELDNTDYGANSSNSASETNESLDRFGKLVYTPESPVNFATFVLNCKQPGFIFVRKIIVRYEDEATSKAYSINSFSNPVNVSRERAKLDLSVPTSDIKDISGYLIKRTSSQNNISQEVVLAPTDDAHLDVDYRKVNLHSAKGGEQLKHQKSYTIRVLDNNRMIKRQLSFVTGENETPTIKRYNNESDSKGAVNKEFRTEDPLTKVPFKVEITTTTTDGHDPAKTVVVYTTDGSAPSVEFGGLDGREVKSINGMIGTGSGVELTRDADGTEVEWTENTTSLNALFKKYNNSVVIKALALPLQNAPSLSGNEANDGNIAKINAAMTYGETSDITRANYVLIDETETFFTTAERLDEKGNFQTTLPEGSPYDMPKADEFRGAYQPNAGNTEGKPAIFTYGGYELYDKTLPGGHKFNHSLLENEYWEVKGNDATPWRGVREMIAGDSYVVSPLEPFNEKAKALYNRGNDKEIKAMKAGDFVDSDNPLRYYIGQFDNKAFREESKSYYRTWKLPCYGDFFRFEPDANGTLTVYVKQQGVLDQEGGSLDDQLLRFRPVYIYDEAGRTPAGIDVATTSKVSGDWMTMKHTDNVGSKYLDHDATEAFKAICDQWIKKTTANEDGDVEYGDRAYKSQAVLTLYGDIPEDQGDLYSGLNRRQSIGDTDITLENLLGTRSRTPETVLPNYTEDNNPNGFMIMSEGYVKYSFPVRAGKTYFMFAANGNLGFCSYTFDKDNNATNSVFKDGEIETVTIEDDGATGVGDGHMNYLLSDCKNKTVNVKLERSFYNNTWAAVVLPFSVSMHQLRKVFGDGVRVVHFNDIASVNGVDYVNTNNEIVHGKADVISVRRHVHQMIVAGVPVFIRPSFSTLTDDNHSKIDNVQFDNVTIEATSVEEVVTNPEPVKHEGAISSSVYPNYVCKGTFTRAIGALNYGDIYMTAADGKFVQRVYTNPSAVTGTRCWISISKSTQPRLLTLANLLSNTSYGVGESSDNTVGDGGVATDVERIDIGYENEDGKVYNLKGQVVRNSADDLDNLPQGVYIINGIKHVVK